MSAERLREAAALMREWAEAATDGPWEMDSSECCVGQTGTQGEDYWVVGERLPVRTGDLRYIASWHPAVALAVADWLGATADHDDATGGHCVCDDAAIAVADAYLGDPS